MHDFPEPLPKPWAQAVPMSASTHLGRLGSAGKWPGMGQLLPIGDRAVTVRYAPMIGIGDTSRCHPSPTTGHTGPYHGGSTGLSLGRDMKSEKTE